ncbi:MAG: ABC-type transport auxiliary lipoprotein family protein [Candidatus Cloacimonadaceae bacterium]|nr:ABC-type transport auxiliary lipoprotein family protein [Candidatus Cloacimonadaceae bacterium]MDP3114890.1 ABC-type transport auxiliary lipoprotein family protein [Candidatus Cloacimonadaceae bacterium]
MKNARIIFALATIIVSALLSGCFGKVERAATNYYVLDYKKATENPSLIMKEPFPKTLEVMETDVNRTYARNNLVIKENFSKIRYLPNDVWASRLSGAVPDLIVQRLRAYNIFSQVDRSTGDAAPSYYLDTAIHSLEKIESNRPRAYLRIEYFLRDSGTQELLLTHKAERYKDLFDESMIFLIQSYNEMIMQETDIFAVKARMFLEGKPVLPIKPKTEMSTLEAIVSESDSQAALQTSDGELLLQLITKSQYDVRFTYEQIDENRRRLYKSEGEFGKEVTLPPGRYRILVGEDQEIPIYVDVKPQLRTVVESQWGEIVVLIIDERRTNVRLTYDIWKKTVDGDEYYMYGSYTSRGDEDLGQPEKVWLLLPGTYMLKLSGGSWNDLRDFATIDVRVGESKVITVVVNPSGERNMMVGAGDLGYSELLGSRTSIHKGAVHGNISVSSNNNVAKNDPSFSVSLSGQLDNSIDADYGILRYNARSIYDIGMNLSNDRNLRISPDNYSLKNVVLLTPWHKSDYFRNFSFYGRADMSTHFFDETLFFPSNKNLIMIDDLGDTLSIHTDQDRLRTKIAFYPMRLKEGTGITYRLIFNPKVTLSLRTGYGWQQEINNRSLTFNRTGNSAVPGDTLIYDTYKEYVDLSNRGIESTLILSALNIGKFFSINSTIDVLFPTKIEDGNVQFESENRMNIRLYRNISLDINANIQYDESKKDWIVWDYSSFLRMSLFY